MTTTSPPPPENSPLLDTDPHTTEPPPSPDRRTLRPMLIRLHFYAGLFIAPFILVAAVSGFLYAATPMIEQVAYDDELTTDSRGPAIPLGEQIQAAREVEPDLPLYGVRPANEPGQTTRVLFEPEANRWGAKEAIFVDPVTGEVQGRLTAYGTSGALPIRTWFDQLHRSFLLGEPGRIYSELAASWLWVIGLGGVVLWWTSRRRELGGAAIWARLRPRRSGSPRQRALSWHGAVGTWLVLGMLVLSATGLTWSRFAGANVTELRGALNWSTPAVSADLDSATSSTPADDRHTGHTGHPDGAGADGASADSPGVGFERVWDAAREDAGLTAYSEILPPADEGTSYVVSEIDRSWPTQVDAAAIDPTTGEVTDVVRFDDYPFMAKMARWGIDLHMGSLFGLANQLGLMLLAVGLVAMIVMGYRMWWLRRPTRGGLPSTPARGAWRQAPPLQLVVLLAVAIAVGWFIPLLGISLLGFVLVDLAFGRLRRG